MSHIQDPRVQINTIVQARPKFIIPKGKNLIISKLMHISHTNSEIYSESSSFHEILRPSLTEPSQVIPFKEGFLLKRTSGVFRRWVRRYFMLENNEFKYFYDKNKSKLGGVLNFNLITADVHLQDSEFRIVPLGTSRIFRFKAKNEQNAVDWVYALSLAVLSSKGNKRVLPLGQKIVYWKHPLVSQKDFVKSCKTGDVLLFRSSSFSSKVQRFVTSCEYDHIALVLKYGKRVSFLQATSGGGVEVVYWEDFLQVGDPDVKVLHRKLEFDRNFEALNKLEAFINSVIGMKFRISTGKLLARKMDKLPQEKRGFFCSELVAMAYKVLGLLPERPPASRYWPGDFYDKKNIQLIGGAAFTSSVFVDFDLE
jgi:hypothetical protein